MSKKYMTIPNALSLSRLIFLPLLYLFILADHLTAFLIGYILIGATDFFDGLIARRFNMTSEIGKALDSIADLFFYISSAWFLYYLYHSILHQHVLLIMFFSRFSSHSTFLFLCTNRHKTLSAPPQCVLVYLTSTSLSSPTPTR
jgi:phosphatidylglycerophosphate synthase